MRSDTHKVGKKITSWSSRMRWSFQYNNLKDASFDTLQMYFAYVALGRASKSASFFLSERKRRNKLRSLWLDRSTIPLASWSFAANSSRSIPCSLQNVAKAFWNIPCQSEFSSAFRVNTAKLSQKHTLVHPAFCCALRRFWPSNTFVSDMHDRSSFKKKIIKGNRSLWDYGILVLTKWWGTGSRPTLQGHLGKN